MAIQLAIPRWQSRPMGHSRGLPPVCLQKNNDSGEPLTAYEHSRDRLRVGHQEGIQRLLAKRFRMVECLPPLFQFAAAVAESAAFLGRSGSPLLRHSTAVAVVVVLVVVSLSLLGRASAATRAVTRSIIGAGLRDLPPRRRRLKRRRPERRRRQPRRPFSSEHGWRRSCRRKRCTTSRASSPWRPRLQYPAGRWAMAAAGHQPPMRTVPSRTSSNRQGRDRQRGG